MEDLIPRIVQGHQFFVYVKSWLRIWVLTLATRTGSFLRFVLFIYINSEIVFPYLTTDLHHRQSSARSELSNIRKSQRFVKQTKTRTIMCIHLLATVNDTFVLRPIGVFSRLLGSYGNSRPTMYEYITRTFELGTYLMRTTLKDILLILAISVGDLFFREEISEQSLDTKTILTRYYLILWNLSIWKCK